MLLTVSSKRWLFEAYTGFLTSLPPSVAVSLEHRRRVGRWPSLRIPKTFNEKILYRKLHGQHELYASLADKVRVKEHVRDALGDGIVTPTLWHGYVLPPRADRSWATPYVVKANNDSGSVLFVRSVADQNWDTIEAFCERALRNRYTPFQHEPWYQLIAPRILIEPYLGDNLVDYKFYVFDGRVTCIHVDTGRFTQHRRCFYDPNWNRLPFTVHYPIESRDISRPRHLKEMVAAAEQLAKGMDFARIDFYDLPEGPRFGEITFAPGSGYEPFWPPEWDRHLGDMWRLQP